MSVPSFKFGLYVCELGLPGHTYLSVSNAFCFPTVSQYTSLSIGTNSSPPVEDSMLQCQLILANTDGQRESGVSLGQYLAS